MGCLHQSRPLTEHVAQRKETATKGLVTSHVKSEDATDESHLSYKSLWANHVGPFLIGEIGIYDH